MKQPRRNNNGMVFLILLGFLLGLCSCVNEHKVRKYISKHPELFLTKEIIKDSISVKDSIITRHDTINIKGEEIKIHDTIPCPELVYHRSVTKNNLTATVDINKGVINVDCKADSLQRIIDIQSHLITTYKSHSADATHLVPIYRVHWYDLICRWLAIILIILSAFYVGKWYLKRFGA